ncbi:MAG: helix-turn-helix domain-containing protein [Bacteroidota bacterium]
MIDDVILEKLLQQGEGYNLEYKEGYARDIASEICAFANAVGGTLLIGVRDDGSVKGIHYNNAKASQLQDTLSHINPKIDVTIDVLHYQGSKIVAITCPSGKAKPYISSGSIYVRVGPNTQKLTTAEEIRDFFQQSDRIFFDEVGNKSFKYPEDFDASKFREFLQKAGIDGSLDRQSLLENLQLFAVNGYFKNAGVLMFAKNTQRFVSTAAIRCLLFKGNTKRYILDDKLMEGSLLEQYDATIAYLKSKLELRYDIEGQGAGPRLEYYEIPEVALREAVVNAIVHRDYYEKGAQIMVEIYDNRVEITNPGGLVSAVPIEKFGQRSFSRNPLVFGLFHRTQLIEKVGSGIRRMRNAMEEADLPPPQFDLEGIFAIRLYRPVNFTRWLDSWRTILTENQASILEIIHQDKHTTTKQLSEQLGISTTAIEKNFQRLRKVRLLARVGSNKAGYWTIYYLDVEDFGE